MGSSTQANTYLPLLFGQFLDSKHYALEKSNQLPGKKNFGRCFGNGIVDCRRKDVDKFTDMTVPIFVKLNHINQNHLHEYLIYSFFQIGLIDKGQAVLIF